MKLSKPLIIRFEPGTGAVTQQNNQLNVPVFSTKADTTAKLNKALQTGDYDYLALSFRNVMSDVQENSKVMEAAAMRANWFLKASKNEQVLPVVNRLEGGQQVYLLNPQYSKDEKTFMVGDSKAKDYAASDEIVEAKRQKYTSQVDWEAHQAQILNKFAQIMPLSERSKEKLTAPKRGLHERDLAGFFDWRSNAPVIPELMGDNMVGIPSIKAQSFSNVDLEANGHPMGTGSLLTLKTGGKSGIMIPMKNPQGVSPKCQVAAEVSKINCFLKAKASDGVSIQKSEYYDKKTGAYHFKMQDGSDSGLKLTAASDDGVTFTDKYGDFDVQMGDNIKNVLTARGYDLPLIIDKLTPTKETKYIWMSQGSMVGSKKIARDISQSNPGFITAREPKNGRDDYVVLVAEGALKGVITAKYVNVPDKEGYSLGDKIAGDKGLIVAQVPGVAKAFVKDVPKVYDGKKIAGTYIAMDADGRDNLNVCKGIHTAYEELSNYGPVKVMSWDPAQKGIDDSLLAIAQGKITLKQMDVHFGNPDKLFPYSQAKSPIPYKLNGERAFSEKEEPAYMQEWEKDKAAFDKKHNQTVANNDEQIDLNLDGLKPNAPQQ